MKHLKITSPQYTFLLQNFKQWLDTIGYAERTINSLPIHVQELLHHLEQKNITQIAQIKQRHITDFSNYIKSRTNKKSGAGLSSSSINKTLQAVKTFIRYINQTSNHSLDASPKRVVSEINERTILTKAEIKKLHEASYEPGKHNSAAIGQRDRAMIAILYGCGLRRNEASRLNLSDIDLIKQRLFVKRGKGGKQRYVPIATKNAEDIRSYLEEGRNWFLEHHYSSTCYKHIVKKENTDDEAFFLNHQGKRVKDFCYRIKILGDKAGIDKDFSPHSLRHSIATHLLQSGMKIEDIARFLGHSSLESTQIYTHIVNQINQKEDEHR